MITKKKTGARKKTVKKTAVARKPASSGKITLNPIIKISDTQDLKTHLNKFLGKKKVNIDASKVEKIDTSALQLLCAFIIEADKQSTEINWHSPSPYFLSSSQLLGLSKLLKLPSLLENNRAN